MPLTHHPFFAPRLLECWKERAACSLPVVTESAGSVTRNDNLTETRRLWRGPASSRAVPSSQAQTPGSPSLKKQLGKCCFHKGIFFLLKTINDVIEGES